jgi:hypothetical protein
MRSVLRALSKDKAILNICSFRHSYVTHWNEWMSIATSFRDGGELLYPRYAAKFRHTLGRWQACRPRTMRPATEMIEILKSATFSLEVLRTTDLRTFRNPDADQARALSELWDVFKRGLCTTGEPGEAGVTKAIMLVTEGRIGPALDSNVKAHLGIHSIPSGSDLVEILRFIATDLYSFEEAHQLNVESLVPEERGPVAVGRAVDMILGPKNVS